MEKLEDGDVSFFVNKSLYCTRNKEKHTAPVLDMVVTGEMFGEKGKKQRIFLLERSARKIHSMGTLQGKRYLPSRLSQSPQN